MSLVIFCLLFSSVDYVPVKGEGQIPYVSQFLMGLIVYILYYGKPNFLDLKGNHILWMSYSQNIYVCIMSIFSTVIFLYLFSKKCPTKIVIKIRTPLLAKHVIGIVSFPFFKYFVLIMLLQFS